MKICAISDTHGLLPKIDPCDLLLIAGDISPLKIQGLFKEMSDWIFNDFINWALEVPCKEIILIAGNHDFWFKSANETQKLLIKYSSGGKITYLENQSTTVYGLEGEQIKIFGTPYCHIFGNWPFMISDSLLDEKFKEIPNEIDIILSHDAPYGVSDVCFQNMKKEHIGSLPLRKRLDEIKYKYLLHGHLHSSNHNWEQFGTGKVVNCSLLNENYNDVYKPLYFEY